MQMPNADDECCSVGGMAVDMGLYKPSFNCGDVIRRANYLTARGFRVWMVMGVHLGAEKQESTYELLPLDYSVGDHQCQVPCILLDLDPSIERIE